MHMYKKSFIANGLFILLKIICCINDGLFYHFLWVTASFISVLKKLNKSLKQWMVDNQNAPLLKIEIRSLMSFWNMTEQKSGLS